RPRRLWIDAICINQDDIAERNAQVAIMQHIYHTAVDVIAWIGEDNGAQDQRAIALVCELGPRGYTLVVRRESREHPRAFLSLYDTDDWLAFLSLIERPWFSRIWIVQEVVMGKRVTVWCGSYQLDWNDLYHSALFLRNYA
ncbi:heterokaryon incompatibility protein-domain-containing protein, partial [Lasiosphaeria ovina]